jgi:hypothetical protein
MEVVENKLVPNVDDGGGEYGEEARHEVAPDDRVTDAGRTGCQDRVENNLTGVWNHERFVAAERQN